MLKKEMERRSIKQQTRKSTDSRQKNRRKFDNPAQQYREMNMNKENIHPNQKESTNQIQDHLFYKEKYYNLRIERQNSKIEKYGRQTISKQQLNQQIHLHPHAHYIPPLKQIDIRKNNQSLEKCQIHPKYKSPPKSAFLITEQEKEDLFCCQECGIMFKNKIAIEKLSDTIIGSGLTIRQYYKLIDDKLAVLGKAKQNLEEYQKQFRQVSSQQMKKHRRYYNQILQTIENSMSESQKILSKYFSSGSMILSNKFQYISQQIEFFVKEKNKLLQFQEKQVKGTEIRQQLQFDIKHSLRNIQTQIQLPMLELCIQIPNLKTEFQKVFNEKYSLKILTQQQFQSLKKKQDEPLKRASTNRQQQDPDLFCDQEFGQNKSSNTHDFSFDQSNEGQVASDSKNNDCILEQVEEEDVISPVFKAI